MTPRERFHAAMNFRPFERLPMIEWAVWWDKTIQRWHSQGLPASTADGYAIYRHFGLDVYYQDWLKPRTPSPSQHGAPLVHSTEEYEQLRKVIYNDDNTDHCRWEHWAAEQQAGEAVTWITLQGFFWFPRVILGIEQHLYAFYDQPSFMHRINEDILQFNLACIDRVCRITTPTS